MIGKTYLLEVKPSIPSSLSMLAELSKDLIYCWHEPVRQLFISLDKTLWESSGHNPSILLRRVSQRKLNEASVNSAYLQAYQEVVNWYKNYQQSLPKISSQINKDEDLIVYFCSEFGLHESFPIYSGGLGILAGDYCKAASDMGLPFIAVGLLYHQGYVNQIIDAEGNQISRNMTHYFGHLPIKLCRDKKGKERLITLQLPGRTLTLRLWEAKVGRVKIVLLDSDIDLNDDNDRLITSQLYGTGHNTRIKQELVLGIGGVKGLRELGLRPNIWHINEGHAAFQILERCREYIDQGVNFDSALELTASSTVFTTHTPVSAGHDRFSHETIIKYCRDTAHQMGIEFNTLLALGYDQKNGDVFNMTALALRGSRFHNGVSKIHGNIASIMESYNWPDIPYGENPITHITNGVHVVGILAQNWRQIFDHRFKAWREHLDDNVYWDCIKGIPDQLYWDTHLALKQVLLEDVCQRQNHRHQRNECSLAFQNNSICQLSDKPEDILILGFARRFASYKRATLLFSYPERLKKILNIPGRRVIILFSGIAHPNDEHGQQIIKDINQFSQQPEFIGKVILLEGYDLGLARHMISGCDIWVNTPIYPLEACGTSGQKAAINGVVNLSLLDGWWAEAYDEKNGWAIQPHTEQYGEAYRDNQEASDLLDIIENNIIPAYFERNRDGIPCSWLQMSKASMQSILPRFCTQRMLKEYVEKLYIPAKVHAKRLHNKGANELTQWKTNIRNCWQGIDAKLIGDIPKGIEYGQPWEMHIIVYPNKLSALDIVVECLKGKEDINEGFIIEERFQLAVDKANSNKDELIYHLELKPQESGLFQYKLRVYPYHTLLAHQFEMGLMRWL